MRTRISQISLVLFVLLMFLSMSLLGMPGDYWPSYIIAAIFTVIPIFIGPKRLRFLGTAALLLSLGMIFGDIESGKHYHQKIQRLREMQQTKDRSSSTNQP